LPPVKKQFVCNLRARELLLLPPVNKKTRLRVQHQLKQQFTAAAITRAREQMQHSTCKLREKTNTSERRYKSSTLKIKVPQKNNDVRSRHHYRGAHLCHREQSPSRVDCGAVIVYGRCSVAVPW
jgi:hypothetical protein